MSINEIFIKIENHAILSGDYSLEQVQEDGNISISHYAQDGFEKYVIAGGYVKKEDVKSKYDSWPLHKFLNWVFNGLNTKE